MKCVICNQDTKTPISSFWSHIKPYETNGFKFFKGNKDAFGLFAAIKSCLCITSPLISTIINWSGRKNKLDFGSDPMVLHVLIQDGKKVDF